MTGAFYGLAFSFWKLLAEACEPLPSGVALANSEAPLLLSNAAWYPKPDGLSEVAAWYGDRDLNAALIVPARRDDDLERALQGGPFALERAFSFLTPEAPAPHAAYAEVVEQVGWAQGRALGDVLAAHYGLSEYGVALGKILSGVMRDPKVTGYVAYDDAPVGAMVAYEAEGSLSAMMLAGAREALEARLVAEASDRGLTASVLEPLDPAIDPGVTVKDERSLERWSLP